VFDPTSFALSDMVDCAAMLRRELAGADSFDDAANRAVSSLRRSFIDEPTGRPAFVLARLFVTQRWEQLRPELQAHARKRLGDELEHPGMRCLVLQASDGDQINWRKPSRSRAHRVIPLPSAAAVEKAPMLAALLRELGLSPNAVTGSMPVSHDMFPTTFGTFHVHNARGSKEVPSQRFVTKHGVRSVLGFGGLLPKGEVFAVVLFSRTPIPSATADLFRNVALSVRLALLPYCGAPTRDLGEHERTTLRRLLELNEATVRDQSARLEQTLQRMRRQDARLLEEAATVETLRSIGTQLAAEMDAAQVMQLATDAARRVTGAKYGSFFVTIEELTGQVEMRYTVSAPDPGVFARLPLPRGDVGLFSHTFNGYGSVRSDDITADDRYGHNHPFEGLPPGHPPVRSYLAVPVVTPSGETLGGLFFGHPDPGMFDDRDERLVAGIAAPAAIALDNARLYEQQRNRAEELQLALLPKVASSVNGMEVASRYLPGGRGQHHVGGDWFDVIPLPCGRTAFVVGDVMGKGIHAAALMGQLRSAVRAYAVMDQQPNEVLRNLNELVIALPGQQLVTCVYVIYDPAVSTLTYANAGHVPPAIVTEDGRAELLESDLGLPLGLEGTIFREVDIQLPRRSSMLLYTDGLVETRKRSLSDGMDQLVEELRHLDGDLSEACLDLVHALTGGDYDDDVTLLLIRDRGDYEGMSALTRLAAEPISASETRRFVQTTLDSWGLSYKASNVSLVADELVTNAIEHAATDIELQLTRLPDRIIVEVLDHDARLPRMSYAAPFEERHRGLLIVQQMSSRWGSRPTRHGKVVWAEVDD
jgi:serine phosphatase RsbU (regulator of sigma subunit)/anti-sigma regulatory factor (Ser/Thr protein kinase)